MDRRFQSRQRGREQEIEGSIRSTHQITFLYLVDKTLIVAMQKAEETKKALENVTTGMAGAKSLEERKAAFKNAKAQLHKPQ